MSIYICVCICVCVYGGGALRDPLNKENSGSQGMFIYIFVHIYIYIYIHVYICTLITPLLHMYCTLIRSSLCPYYNFYYNLFNIYIYITKG
jgi:hypothetical protein